MDNKSDYQLLIMQAKIESKQEIFWWENEEAHRRTHSNDHINYGLD